MHRRVAASLLIMALMVVATGAAAQTTSGGIDVAAVTLRPADIGSSGWVHDGAFVEHLDAEAANAAAYLGRGTSADSVAARLMAAGWLQMYVDNLSLPATPAGADPTQRIRSYVTEYASADGAADGFAFLEDESSIPSANDVPASRTFGEESEITSDRGTSAIDGRTYRSLDLTFRTGNIVAGVTLIVYPSRLTVDPDQTIVESLGALLETRLANPGTDGASLGRAALRLNLPDQPLVSYDDAYYRIESVDVPLSGESESAAALRVKTYADAVDVYQLWQGVDVGATNGVLYGVTLLHFPSEEAAAGWVTNLSAILGENPFYADLQTVPIRATLGDQSNAVSYVAGGGAGKPRAMAMAIAIRVGADVARIHLVPQGRTSGMTPAPLVDLARAEADCLTARDCAALTTLPASLAAPPEASPVASPTAGN